MKLEQPIILIRLKPVGFNLYLTSGFRYHLPIRGGAKSACGLVLEGFVTETKLFENVKINELCSMCFRGLEVSDGKKSKHF